MCRGPFLRPGKRLCSHMAGLTQAYDSLVAKGELKDDPAQRAALPEFDRVEAALKAPVKKGLFRKAPEPPKGVYFWGGVGRGKSMLMDLFVQQLDGIAASFSLGLSVR